MNRREFITGVAAVAIAGPSVEAKNILYLVVSDGQILYFDYEGLREFNSIYETIQKHLMKGYAELGMPNNITVDDVRGLSSNMTTEQLVKWYNNLEGIHAGKTSRTSNWYQPRCAVQELQGSDHYRIRQHVPSEGGVLRGLQSGERQSSGGDGCVHSAIEAIPARGHSTGHLEIDVRTSVPHRDDMPSDL